MYRLCIDYVGIIFLYSMYWGGFSGVPVVVNNIYAPALATTGITSVTVLDDNGTNLVIGSTLEVWIEM